MLGATPGIRALLGGDDQMFGLVFRTSTVLGPWHISPYFASTDLLPPIRNQPSHLVNAIIECEYLV